MLCQTTPNRLSKMSPLKLLLLVCALVLRNANVCTCGRVPLPYPWHNMSSGGHMRCMEKRCHKGTVAQLCEPGKPTTTSCRPCDPDTHYSDRESSSLDGIYSCTPKDICTIKEGLKTLSDNDNTMNRQCVCDMDLGYYDINHHLPLSGRLPVCYYCPYTDSYVDPHLGCTICQGEIYFFEDFKYCRTTSASDRNRTSQSHKGVLGTSSPTVQSYRSDRKSSQSPAVVVVVAVCVVLGCVVVALGCWLLYKKYQLKNQRKSAESLLPATVPMSQGNAVVTRALLRGPNVEEERNAGSSTPASEFASASHVHTNDHDFRSTSTPRTTSDRAGTTHGQSTTQGGPPLGQKIIIQAGRDVHFIQGDKNTQSVGCGNIPDPVAPDRPNSPRSTIETDTSEEDISVHDSSPDIPYGEHEQGNPPRLSLASHLATTSLNDITSNGDTTTPKQVTDSP